MAIFDLGQRIMSVRCLSWYVVYDAKNKNKLKSKKGLGP